MTDKDKIKLKKYNQSIIDSPRPLDDQWWKQDKKYVWCHDWEIIELLKYMFLGRSEYMGDPPPNRLKGNPMFDKNEIADKAEQLMKEKDVDGIIEHFRAQRLKRDV